LANFEICHGCVNKKYRERLEFTPSRVLSAPGDAIKPTVEIVWKG
jgi:hypothetical protein